MDDQSSSRRFRFSLRAGLIAVAAIGLTLSWPAWEIRRIAVRRSAISEILKNGGRITTDDLEPYDQVELNARDRLRYWLGDVLVRHIEIPPSLQDRSRRFEWLFPEAETMTVIGTPEPRSR